MEEHNEEIIEDDDGENPSKWKTRFGCLWLVMYLGMAIFEMFAINDWLVWKYELNTFLSVIASIFAGLTPGLGSLLAYFGATDVWGWEKVDSVVIFFWYYIPIAIVSFLSAMLVMYVLLMVVVGRIKALLNNS